MKIMRLAAVVALAAGLAACERPEAQPPAPVGEVPQFDPDCRFCADPAFVRTCDVAAGVRTTLHWDVEDPDVPTVGIFVVDDEGRDSPFAEQAAKGSIETGPWLKPGLTFKLKDPAGNVLETLTISGRDC